MTRFLLGRSLRVEEAADPFRTVLQYLREDLGRTGTKEGCAEGDCGACTVVVAERVADAAGDRLGYRSVNACIQIMGTLDGKVLLTVEDLKRGRALHPVQQAMVACHASQCGFCTPGFIMSLFALYKNDPCPDRQAINDALAGNLCRCTGYRPIVDAACEAYRCANLLSTDALDWIAAPAGAASEVLGANEAEVLARLREIERTESACFTTTAGTFYVPRNLADLDAILAKLPHALILAGATDVGLSVTKERRSLGNVIYTGRVAELRETPETDATIEIGGAVTVHEAMRVLAKAYPDFYELFRRYGSPAIRNIATLGGNIVNASPVGDSMPGLIALNATVILRARGATREIALEELYVGYRRTAMAAGEILQSVRVPQARAGLVFRTYKLSKRFDQDISAVCAAFALVLDRGRVSEVRIAFGGMAAMPQRARATEDALIGNSWSEGSVRRAMQALRSDYSPIADMRGSARYRLMAAENLLYRFYLETTAASASAPTRLYDAHFELQP